MTTTTADSMGMTMQYSKEWFNWRQKIIASRNAQIAGIDEVNKGDALGGLAAKKAAWKSFWAELDKKAVFVDTRDFFNPKTGELLNNEQAKRQLAAFVGEDHVPILLARAQERYLQYIEDKNSYFDELDSQTVLGERTAEEAGVLKKEWQNKNSPNVFFDRSNNARTYSTATERYVTMAPKISSTEMWNEDYKGLMADEKLANFYSRYKVRLDELMSYLPKTIQDRTGADFLPVVRKEILSDMFNIKDWVKTYNEKFIRSIGASAWEEQMNDRLYNKIPIDYVNSKDTAVEDRSKDMIGMMRVFGMMALHYKHFSAAKDYIGMSEAVLKEINRSRLEGNTQQEQNGKVVTVKKGLRNSLDALQYLTDYAMYRKPKALEGNTKTKLYAKNDGQGKKFSLNPIKQIAMGKEVNRLLKEREELEASFTADDNTMTEEEYQLAVEPLNKELSKYEGYSLHGSKIGDKLIGINQLKALSYNPFSAVANVTFGLISTHIHAAGGRDFTRHEVGAAQKLMLKAKFDKKLASKILAMMDRLGVIGDYVDASYGKAPDPADELLPGAA